jgi:DNA polymerase-4
MPHFMALQRCPELVFVRPRFDHYREISAGIREIFHSYTPLVEPLSLDEAYLDVTALGRPASEVATEIRQRIRESFRLPASAGISSNKLLAKIASDWRKPNGQFVIRPSEVDDFIRKLPVRRLWGVGKRAEEKLAQLGCHTCEDLQRLSVYELEESFGKFGRELYDQCRGVDRREVQPTRIRKSLSNERTYVDEVETGEQLAERIADLHEELIADLQARPELLARVAGPFVKVKFTDFTQTTVSRSGVSWDLPTMVTLAQEAFARKPMGARLLGVGVRFVESGSVGEQLLLPLTA